jgi:V8-like Glu-specific endopeptidase
MKKSLLATLAAITIVVASPATPVFAAANDGGSAGSNGVSVYDPTTKRTFVPASAAEADRLIGDYWTAERRAAAKPVDLVPAKQSKTVHQPDTSQAPVIGSYPVGPAVSPGGDVGTQVNFTNAAGKVFFTDPGFGDFVCSASTLNTAKARLVFTAGHCVHHGPGGTWASNWSFFPGYSFGSGAAGQFTAWQLWTKNGWINNADSHFDYGIAITNNSQFGQKVVNAVGGNGIVYNAGRPFVTSFGYPVAIQGGEAQLQCQGQLSRRNIINSDQKLPCAWSGGASGGPMLRDYDTSFPRLGWIVSVLAYILETGGPTFGPYLDGDAQSLVNSAEGASPA